MSNTEALITQVSEDLSKYDDSGLIDKDTLYREVILALRGFGNDICVPDNQILEVKNGYGIMNDNFFSLKTAYLCTPLHYVSNVEKHYLIDSTVYKERIASTQTWNECSAACCTEQSEQVIKENVYIKGRTLEFYYHNPQLLKLKSGFNTLHVHPSCQNVFSRCSHEISLNNRTMRTNFDCGTVYVEYYGLPADDKGRVDIPDTANGHLEQYIEYRLKRKLSEILMGNNDAQALQGLYGAYSQREEREKALAESEIKMAILTPDAMQALRIGNRLQTLKFELVGPWR